jgi:hypothetical protein
MTPRESSASGEVIFRAQLEFLFEVTSSSGSSRNVRKGKRKHALLFCCRVHLTSCLVLAKRSHKPLQTKGLPPYQFFYAAGQSGRSGGRYGCSKRCNRLCCCD